MDMAIETLSDKSKSRALTVGEEYMLEARIARTREIAVNFLKMNSSFEYVAEGTGLPLEEVMALARGLDAS